MSNKIKLVIEFEPSNLENFTSTKISNELNFIQSNIRTKILQEIQGRIDSDPKIHKFFSKVIGRWEK